jgi:hypothetical protein
MTCIFLETRIFRNFKGRLIDALHGIIFYVSDRKVIPGSRGSMVVTILFCDVRHWY